MISRLLLAVVASLCTAGCVQFYYDAPPVTHAGSGPVEQCIQEKAITVSGARAEWDTSKDIGGGWAKVTTHELQGVAFYQNGLRLDAVDALAVIGDSSVEQAYRQVWQKDHRAANLRNGFGVSMILLGAASMILGGTVWGDLTHPGAIAMLAAGGPVLGIGVLLNVISFRPRKVSKAYRTIFSSMSLATDVDHALERYNQDVIAGCSGKGVVFHQ